MEWAPRCNCWPQTKPKFLGQVLGPKGKIWPPRSCRGGSWRPSQGPPGGEDEEDKDYEDDDEEDDEVKDEEDEEDDDDEEDEEDEDIGMHLVAHEVSDVIYPVPDGSQG